MALTKNHLRLDLSLIIILPYKFIPFHIYPWRIFRYFINEKKHSSVNYYYYINVK